MPEIKVTAPERNVTVIIGEVRHVLTCGEAAELADKLLALPDVARARPVSRQMASSIEDLIGHIKHKKERGNA